jgi:WD40 repeat protein
LNEATVRQLKPRLALVGHSARVHSVVFSPDGKLLISAAAKDPALKIWDLATGKEIRTLLAAEGGFGRPVFSPDGKSLAAFSDGAVRIWDVATCGRF